MGTPPLNICDLKKGDLLGVKAPPYYKNEYVYEITSAGEKVIRAALRHSPRVRKAWTVRELELLVEMDVVRLIPADAG
jgi:hypothetical protein